MRRGFRAGGGRGWSYGRCLGPLPKPNAPREAQARDARREEHAELAPHAAAFFLCSGGSGVQRGGGVSAAVVQRGVDRGGGVQQCNQQRWAGLAAVQFRAAGGEEPLVVGAIGMQQIDDAYRLAAPH